ncbi:hypothetical protein DH2020_034919 [Rehmannia glutinosa]|uniref:Uncharacterized protein n=1 Tax=Rehmannia glutinosa TaxID=99300 RepID=A0ABR0VB35_REHGL
MEANLIEKMKTTARIANAAKEDNNGVYIVYMGASRLPNGAPRSDHDHLLSVLLKRKKNSVVETYSNGFLGFAARLSEEEAKSIAQRPGVVSVFRDPVLQLHTTRSWDFLKYQTALKTDSTPSSPFASSSTGADTIIGILDTGIWPEAESFIDEDMGPIPSHWKGSREQFLLRHAQGREWARHTRRIDCGWAAVSGASYYGLANGTAEGDRQVQESQCSSPGEPDFATDPIAIGAFHAVEKGIIVVCSAGNSGPISSSVVNVAPWILTVAATTIDRDFEADIVLGGNKVIKGGGINFSGLNRSTVHPLIDGRSAQSTSNQHDEADARNCVPGSLDDGKVKGKIVICESTDENYEPNDKFDILKNQGAIGMIVIDNDERQVPSKYGTFPIAAVTEEDGATILSYINSTRANCILFYIESNPVATILPTVMIQNYKPAPAIGYFSSRGPTFGIKNLLKPDIAAPGVAILAAWPSNDKKEALPERDPPLFDVLSGTSMACPHVSGLAATVKSQHPTWSASSIRSAIMTTAIQTNNLHAPITTNTGSIATPYDIGAGEISLTGPLQPGLVYETETIDYVYFLCNMGYDANKIKSIALAVPNNFSCPSSSGSDSISNMNYPSIAVSSLKTNESKTVNRTVTNVGDEDSTYTAAVEIPAGLHVEVVPNKLQFSKSVKKLSFQVTFKLTAASKEDLFGSVTWANEKYKVRSPFVVSNA